MSTEAALTEALRAIQRDLGRIETDLRPLLSEPLQREVDIGNLRQMVLLLQKDVDALLNGRGDLLTDVDEKRAEIQRQVDELVTRVARLRDEVESMIDAKVGPVDARVNGVEARVTTVEGDVTGLEHSFEMTKTRVLAWLAGAGFVGSLASDLLGAVVGALRNGLIGP